jgi:Ca2+/H+ antiporter
MPHQLRFTVRSLMLVVALVGLVMSLVVYRERLWRRAEYHQAQIAEHSTRIPASPSPPPGTLVVNDPETGTMTAYRMTPQVEWHARMASQYSGSAYRIGLLIAAVLLISVLSGIARALIRRKNRQSDPKSPGP